MTIYLKIALGPPYQWLFLVPLKGGRWHIIPQLAGKIPLIVLAFCGGPICYQAHLFTAIDLTSIQPNPNYFKGPEFQHEGILPPAISHPNTPHLRLASCFFQGLSDTIHGILLLSKRMVGPTTSPQRYLPQLSRKRKGAPSFMGT